MVPGTKTGAPFLQWLQSEPWRAWKDIGLTGLKGSSKAYWLALWLEKMKGPLLIVVPRLEDAESLLEDLRFFQADEKIPALLFPSWETIPYDQIAPHPEIIQERVKGLFSLLKGERAAFVVPVRALFQKVLSPGELEASTRSLSVGEEMGRDPLVQFLNKNGFTQVSVVEEKGDFSTRGAIVDIYAPLYDEPLRLEFDGDRLESIRRFETETQRSIPQSAMDRTVLLPARDLSESDSQTPVFTLFDYFKGDEAIFIEEGEEVEREMKVFSDLIEEHYEKALSRGEAVPPPESSYLSCEEMTSHLNRFQKIFLQEGPIAPPQCQHVFPVDMESNEDLQNEIKASLAA